MKIYTKTGDKGETSLATGQRVSKADWRLEAYGAADELNSFIGLLRSELDKTQAAWAQGACRDLQWVQNRLFDIGAILAGSDLHFPAEDVHRLEEWIDRMQAELPVLRAFVLPAGNEAMTRCHVCRTVARRLERNIVRWGAESGVDTNGTVLCFVNRLSDYCFVLARWIGHNEQIAPVAWEK